ncbi:unnamed protein product [Adineta steineri]|uniref:Uncharacterized protein n=1 Tax=Adineta steineri TaxID=433720 RepID=A0A814H4H0_9BILA|nr:unnamed protein product [Adineta steineri]CAF1233231.1 unnamed protein product [Adineta steineri]CAF1304299.1 unnamed protein product [Adineta steineri]CAF1342920.1 unnamed protein product [Adineta steineri]CAF1438111.1 unnamed protein product [Adineta steineri]
MASAVTSSLFQQQPQPPTYILQSWHREQPTSHDAFLIEQVFLIGPDAAVPSSRLRQCIEDVYEQRAQALIIVNYDPWEKIPPVKSKSKSKATSTHDLPKTHVH